MKHFIFPALVLFAFVSVVPSLYAAEKDDNKEETFEKPISTAATSTAPTSETSTTTTTTTTTSSGGSN